METTIRKEQKDVTMEMQFLGMVAQTHAKLKLELPVLEQEQTHVSLSVEMGQLKALRYVTMGLMTGLGVTQIVLEMQTAIHVMHLNLLFVSRFVEIITSRLHSNVKYL